MSDNDLIRRKDALAAVQGFEYGWHAEDVIAALPAALSRCPYGASGDDCCGGYCSMDDDKKGGDACDKDDDPTNARPATSPGVTAGANPLPPDPAAIREAALWEAADLCFKNADGITEAVSASPQIKKRRVLLQRAEQSKVDAAAILALIQKGAADDRTDPMQELIDAYEDIMDYGIVFAKKAQQDRLKAAKERIREQRQ